MTRLETPIKDILGTKYYTYQLMATNYNPALNGTITIVCAVSNDYNAEQPSSVILYQNDVEIGSGTLQTTGTYKDHYTWTITCDTPGLQVFRVKDASIEVYVENKVTAIDSSSTDAQYPSAKAVYDFKQPVAIPENDDLNNYNETGIYKCIGSDIAATLSNSPVTVAFGLYVENNGTYDGTGVVQILKEYSKPREWRRTFYTDNSTFNTSGWKGWAYSEEIPNGGNLNNYIIPGTYYQGANNNTTNISNLPSNNHIAFCLLVEEMGGNAKKQTLTFQQNDNKTYVRVRKWDSTWTTWSALN